MNSCSSIEEFDKSCRICLSLINEPIPILLDDVKDMLMECTSVKVIENEDSSSHLPNKICDTCHNHLKIAFNLRRLSEKSEIQLVTLLESSKIDPIEAVLFKEESNDTPVNDCIITDSESDKPEITNKKIFTCDLCSKTMDNKLDIINDHLKEFHKTDGMKCEQCLFIGYSQEILTTHLTRTHKINEILTCGICNKTFTKRYKFNKHKLSHNKERPHQCPNCDNNYKTIWSLKHHVASVHTHTLKKVVCDTCGKTIRETSLQSHLRTHIKKQTHPCQFCNKILFSEKTLLEHVQIKHEKKPRNYRLLCYICGIGIKSKGTLKDHLLVHTREKPYNCEKCDKRYRTKAALSGHIARAHLDLRNHICSICGRGFYDRVILENHTRTHTGERPFKCHVCEKSFSFQAALRTHMKIHSKTYHYFIF